MLNVRGRFKHAEALGEGSSVCEKIAYYGGGIGPGS